MGPTIWRARGEQFRMLRLRPRKGDGEHPTVEQDAAIVAQRLASIEPRAKEDKDASAARAESQRVKESFFRRHAAEIYDGLTEGCTKPRRLADLLYAAAELYPQFLPTRAAIEAERGIAAAIGQAWLRDRAGPFHRPCAGGRTLRHASHPRHAAADAGSRAAACRLPPHRICRSWPRYAGTPRQCRPS